MVHFFEGVTLSLLAIFLFAQDSDSRLLETGILISAIGAMYLYQQKLESKRSKEAAEREDKYLRVIEDQRNKAETVLTNLLRESSEALKMHSISMDHNTAHIRANTEALNSQTERFKSLEDSWRKHKEGVVDRGNL